MNFPGVWAFTWSCTYKDKASPQLERGDWALGKRRLSLTCPVWHSNARRNSTSPMYGNMQRLLTAAMLGQCLCQQVSRALEIPMGLLGTAGKPGALWSRPYISLFGRLYDKTQLPPLWGHGPVSLPGLK